MVVVVVVVVSFGRWSYIKYINQKRIIFMTNRYQFAFSSDPSVCLFVCLYVYLFYIIFCFIFIVVYRCCVVVRAFESMLKLIPNDSEYVRGSSMCVCVFEHNNK